jgi:hypothetical protein
MVQEQEYSLMKECSTEIVIGIDLSDKKMKYVKVVKGADSF